MSDEQRLSTHVEPPMGFEDEFEGDFIIPRVKVIQALSPERKAKEADEGDIINSLTKEKLNGLVFIPVFKFNNNIRWKPRADGGGIACIARDGLCGIPTDGSPNLNCLVCKANEFDNSKTGPESYPKCTKYINFFGFFRGMQLPVILSFSKTNFSEGKKMYSLAKVSMQNMWHNGYRLDEKKMVKGGNEWYIVNPSPVGAATQEERDYGLALYQQFRKRDFQFDAEDTQASANETGPKPEEVSNTEF